MKTCLYLRSGIILVAWTTFLLLWGTVDSFLLLAFPFSFRARHSDWTPTKTTESKSKSRSLLAKVSISSNIDNHKKSSPFQFLPTCTSSPPLLEDVCETTGVTLTRFMMEVERVNPELQELAQLFSGIQTAAKAIANLVKRSQLPSSSTLGYQGHINVQGEDQKKLDVITNNVLKLALRHTGKVQVLASEEEDAPVGVVNHNNSNNTLNSKEKDVLYDEGSKYVTVFDPLDGSSNVDAAIPTGTIFGIFPHDEFCDISSYLESNSDPNHIDMNEVEINCMVNTLQPGINLVASGYILYSSSTILTLTIGCGVNAFTLDEQLGEFILSHPNIRIPDSAPIMSFNEANYDMWDLPMQKVHQKWRTGTSHLQKRYSSRYVGSMVADVHRTLMYGGVFGYPGDVKNKNGKLRLLYEAAPMSFLIEQAGGLSTTGTKRIMEIVPEHVHQRVPVILGSKKEVEEVIDAYSLFQASTKHMG